MDYRGLLQGPVIFSLLQPGAITFAGAGQYSPCSQTISLLSPTDPLHISIPVDRVSEILFFVSLSTFFCLLSPGVNRPSSPNHTLTYAKIIAF